MTRKRLKLRNYQVSPIKRPVQSPSDLSSSSPLQQHSKVNLFPEYHQNNASPNNADIILERIENTGFKNDDPRVLQDLDQYHQSQNEEANGENENEKEEKQANKQSPTSDHDSESYYANNYDDDGSDDDDDDDDDDDNNDDDDDDDDESFIDIEDDNNDMDTKRDIILKISKSLGLFSHLRNKFFDAAEHDASPDTLQRKLKYAEGRARTVIGRFTSYVVCALGTDFTFPITENSFQKDVFTACSKLDTHLQLWHNYLVKVDKRTPDTLMAYMNSLTLCITWFLDFKGAYGLSKDPQLPGRYLSIGLDSIKTFLRKDRRNSNRKRKSTSYMDKVRQHKAPLHGLKELQQHVMAGKNAIDSQFGIQVGPIAIDPKKITIFLSFLFSYFYVFAIQGRVNAFRLLRFGERGQLLDGTFLSTHFKTASAFGFQPINIVDGIKTYIQIWLDRIRPAILQSLGSSKRRSLIAQTSPLFINSVGNEVDVSHLITKYFLNYKLHLTSNTIRSIVEMTADELQANGTITSDQRASVYNVNGHSKSTSQRYYQHHDAPRLASVGFSDVASARRYDATNSQDVMDAYSAHVATASPHNLGAQTSNLRNSQGNSNRFEVSSILDMDDFAERESSQVAIAWGALHPDHALQSAQRIRWTQKEIFFIGKWIDEAFRVNPAVTTVYAKCRKAIQQDYPEMIPYFHIKHILSGSETIKYGYTRYLQLKDNATVSL